MAQPPAVSPVDRSAQYRTARTRSAARAPREDTVNEEHAYATVQLDSKERRIPGR